MIALRPSRAGVLLPIRARPGAKRDAIGGEQAGALKVLVTAPPEKGKANDAILELLADQLGVRRRALELVHGAAAADKVVLIAGVALDELRARLGRILEGESQRQ